MVVWVVTVWSDADTSAVKGVFKTKRAAETWVLKYSSTDDYDVFIDKFKVQT